MANLMDRITINPEQFGEVTDDETINLGNHFNFTPYSYLLLLKNNRQIGKLMGLRARSKLLLQKKQNSETIQANWSIMTGSLKAKFHMMLMATA